MNAVEILATLEDHDISEAWRELSDDEKAALPAGDRKHFTERFNELNPWSHKVSKRLKVNGFKHPIWPASAPIAHSALELMTKEFAPMRWTVDDLVPEGTVLLAGKPKSGKSWLLLNLLVCAGIDGFLLNKRVTQCGSLYLALEDNDRRMRRRLDTLLVTCRDRMQGLARMQYRCEWAPGEAGAAHLDEFLELNPDIRIVGVDTLKMIRGTQDGRRDAYSLDYEAVLPWKRVAEKRGITLIIVHHTRKAEAADVFDEISGTLGLTGSVDQMIVLRRLPQDPKQATLHTRGRDLPEDVELGIELREGWWHLLGSASELAANDSRRAVLDVLRDQPAGMSVTDLLKSTGKKSRPSMNKLVSRMAADGLLRKSANLYLLPLSI